MSDDNRNLPPADQPDPPGDGDVKGPAQWEPRPTPETQEVDTGSEGEASYLADDKMSLGSKLRGGGRDQGGEAPGESMRLCPACGRVTAFIDDTCPNCKHKLGTGGFEDAQQLRSVATGQAELPITRILLMVLIGVVIIAILIIALPRLFNRSQQSTTPEPETIAESRGASFAGELDQIEIDAEFKQNLAAAVTDGNVGWERAGVDCYVYRISILENIQIAASQQILVTGYLGGEDHRQARDDTGDVPFRTGIAPFFDQVNSKPGVELSIAFEYTGGDATPARDDIYLVYGYYFGLEHMHEFEKPMEALEIDKFNNGEYPGKLRQNMLEPTVNTRGTLYFISSGMGYLPIYETDSSGKIIMGTGSGIDSYKPERCIGYYLVKFTKKEDAGLDLFSEEEMRYFIEKLAPFPYAPSGPVTNMTWTPDGMPDGIGCVIKNGVLQK